MLALVLFLSTASQALATAPYGTVENVMSFSVPKSPSGLFYHADADLLYVLCGTNTNGDHYMYGFTTAGAQKCMITIPEAVGMSRVDGFYIVGNAAYIVDSQGPIYASTKLGGSVYEVEWTNPCGCSAGVRGDATCTTATATWSPTIVKKIIINAAAASINDGGGNDEFFRNSGIVVNDGFIYGVNGVHPNPDLYCCYPKSIVKVSATDTTAAGATAVAKWSFTASSLGHDVDMEGLTCGPDGCSTHMYVGDEYNLIYKLNLMGAGAAAVEMQWNLRDIVGSVNDDKGIEALTYSSSTGHFYAGIQETATIHVVKLTDTNCTTCAFNTGGQLSSSLVLLATMFLLAVFGMHM